MLPRLQSEDDFDQFASDAIPIYLLKLLKQCLPGICNGRPFDIGAIADMRRSTSYGLPPKNIAERGEQNRHGQVYEQGFARKAENISIGVVGKIMNPYEARKMNQASVVANKCRCT